MLICVAFLNAFVWTIADAPMHGSWPSLAPEPTAVSFEAAARRAAYEVSAPRALEPVPGRAHISAVFTHPERWREGVATAMLACAEDAMRTAGYAEAQLWTPEQAPARHFYEATGWTNDGRRQWLAEIAMPIVAYVKAL